MWPSAGAAPTLSRRKIGKSITKLQDIAELDFLKSKGARKILKSYDYKRQWHSKKGKGFGRAAKRRSFKYWYDRRITTKNCVYAFWNGSHCLYIGRTLNGKGRPTAHFDKYWFGKATRVDVFGFDRKRNVPQYECMLTHKYEPSNKQMTPSSRRYYTPCPVCVGRKYIKEQVKRLFRLR